MYQWSVCYGKLPHLKVLRSGVTECSLLLLMMPPAPAAEQGARTPADAMRVLRTSAALPWLALPPAIALLQDRGLAGGARGRLTPAGSCFAGTVPALLARAIDAAVCLQ
jgi:hypothetical protein